MGMGEPFLERSKARKEMINEGVILSSIYFVMCFSDLVTDFFAQTVVGYAFCALLAVHIVINILIIMFSSVVTNIKKFRRWLFIRKHKRIAKLKR